MTTELKVIITYAHTRSLAGNGIDSDASTAPALFPEAILTGTLDRCDGARKPAKTELP
jgi:hypothetical protein